MYYTAFFIDNRYFLKKVFNDFIEHEKLTYTMTSNYYSDINDLLNHSSSFNESLDRAWLLCNTTKHDYSSLFLEFEIYRKQIFSSSKISEWKISLSTINNLFSKLADNFSWSIFPWGGNGILQGFAFVSSNKYLRDKFIKIADKNVIEKTDKELILYSSKLLISKYDVKDYLSNYIKAIIFDIFDNPGFRVWDCNDCEYHHPLLITNTMQDDIEYRNESLDFQVLDIVKLNLLRTALDENLKLQSSSIDYPVCIAKIFSRDLFNSDCRELLAASNFTQVAVAGDSDINCLLKVLKDTEFEGENYLTHISSINTCTSWFYGLGIDKQDTNHSVLISPFSDLLNEIDSFNINDDYKLIACF